MVRKVLYPVAAVAALGLAFSFNGCSCHAEAGTETAKAPEPPPPPPAPAPPPPAAPAAPPPAADAPKIVSVGKAEIKGDEVKIPGAIEFDVDKATIRETPQSKEILNTLAEFMKTNQQVSKLSVEGYTDNSGKADHNLKLSQDRADAVAKWLGDHGVDKGRLDTKGFGQDHPIANNDTAANKQLNRRTEFHVKEMSGKLVTAGDVAAAAAGGPTGGGAASDKPAAPPGASKRMGKGPGGQ